METSARIPSPTSGLPELSLCARPTDAKNTIGNMLPDIAAQRPLNSLNSRPLFAYAFRGFFTTEQNDASAGFPASSIAWRPVPSAVWQPPMPDLYDGSFLCQNRKLAFLGVDAEVPLPLNANMSLLEPICRND